MGVEPSAGLSRRELLLGAGATIAVLGGSGLACASAASVDLVAARSTQVLATPGGPLSIDAWCYGGSLPGPLLRYKRGDRLDVVFENRLDEPSSVHWHGLRPPNAMDGAAPLTQAPVEPGARLRYAFDLEDAGTFWYHTHFRGWNQQDRGLYGILIVDEDAPPLVDRDVLLVLDDWLINPDGRLDTNFRDLHAWAHAGRLGTLATINNAANPDIGLVAGERVRLRIANVANAQIFALLFGGHGPIVVAEDGNPVAPRPLGDAPLLLGPGQRVDLILDALAKPSSRHPITAYTLQDEIRIGTLAYAPEAGGSGLAGMDPPVLEATERPRPDIENARRVELRMEGGAMGGMRRAMLGGSMMDMRELMRRGWVWAFNGVAGDMDSPLATLARGESALVELVNDTAFPHAMHLHGMHFREVERNGVALADGPWRDTSLLGAGDRVAIAFVAERPGKWMLHCHMIEHQAGGMMTYLAVNEP